VKRRERERWTMRVDCLSESAEINIHVYFPMWPFILQILSFLMNDGGCFVIRLLCDFWDEEKEENEPESKFQNQFF